MTDAPSTALARKIAAHAAGPQWSDLAVAAEAAFGRALRFAATPFAGLGLELGSLETQMAVGLPASVEALPAQGLVAVLEDADGARGLLALSHGLIDALIEAQTTGHVEAVALPARPVTQVDEALTRDFIDLTLSAFTQEVLKLETTGWPSGLRFGSRIEDRSQISLLLADGAYHIVPARLGFRDVERHTEAVIILPARAPIRAAEPGVAPDPSVWRNALLAQLQAAPLDLQAVLLRHQSSYGKITQLAPGDMVPFAPVDLEHVTLTDAAGAVILRGRLGQLGGKRALKITGEVAAEAAEATSAEIAPTPSVESAASPPSESSEPAVANDAVSKLVDAKA